ncbi:MAG: response regulator [Fusobacteriota bacterium]
MKVLVVEDEKNIAKYLKKGLSEAGYIVEVAYDGEEAIFRNTYNSYDVILLDIMIPKYNGIEVVKKLREKGNSSHIIMLTAKDKVEDKVEGLDAGADDYITKPFAFAELLARVRSVLRRDSEDKQNKLKVKDLEMDIMSRKITRDGKKIDLTAKEFSLLEYFLRNVNQVLTRTMIAEKVWDIDYLTDTNVIDVYINHLRNKIENPFDSKLIFTVRGVGYILKN